MLDIKAGPGIAAAFIRLPLKRRVRGKRFFIIKAAFLYQMLCDVLGESLPTERNADRSIQAFQHDQKYTTAIIVQWQSLSVMP